MNLRPSTAYCYIPTPLGDILAVQGEKGLEQLLFPLNGIKISPEHSWIEDSIYLKQTSDEIMAYFNKELTTFSITLAPKGTPFQQRVWSTLIMIPIGTTVSYKYVAESINNPKACRAVGGAIGKNPIPIIIPCHRVIGTDGSLTGFASGLDIKRYLLNLEGVAC
ncbi:MAG: methylated-DNA--[protein]-cysteine S-methyltransferase [Desulfamplus sp.]|nr:methylated-DNA--[protein]-cysteine S-methyltransferase [Desulfamplus sp.]MBF0411978.1 methylated-DNA--[protein]-cysteine S-methyltransferase [Desulfamplus sp.]